MSDIFSRIRSSFKGRLMAALNNWRKFIRSWYRDQHQLTSTTEMNRYPELFSAMKDFLAGSHPRVLSYGCSTGEECATLEKYINPSLLIGADINESNLRIARRRYSGSRLQFTLSTPETLKATAPYDVIFCLSVLCRWEETRNVEDCSGIYPFEKFNAAIVLLDNLLAAGGLLVIYNSNFRFEDTQTFAASGYTPVPTDSVPNSGFVHKFDRFNRRIREIHKTCVYRKTGRP